VPENEQWRLHEEYEKHLDPHFVKKYESLRGKNLEDLIKEKPDSSLHKLYYESFEQFKKKFGPIIREIHIDLARLNSVEQIMNEEKLLDFEIKHFGVDVRLLRVNYL
jgi:hypothetical protein